MHLETPRLCLRRWTDADGEAFAELNADPQVMADLGGPLSRSASDAKLERYVEVFETYGFGRWAIETFDGEFLGYTGIMPVRREHPLGPHEEIGWRLTRQAWGQGYATEAAMAALEDGFTRADLTQVLSYTAADNRRSQAVMARLGLCREPSLDFSDHDDRVGTWRGLVWVARRP